MVAESSNDKIIHFLMKNLDQVKLINIISLLPPKMEIYLHYNYKTIGLIPSQCNISEEDT